MEVNSISAQSFRGNSVNNGNNDINGISPDVVQSRIKDLNHETPALFTTSLIKEPQEITLRAVTRNNLMLEQVIENQNKIIENQNKMLGAKLDKQA